MMTISEHQATIIRAIPTPNTHPGCARVVPGVGRGGCAACGAAQRLEERPREPRTRSTRHRRESSTRPLICDGAYRGGVEDEQIGRGGGGGAHDYYYYDDDDDNEGDRDVALCCGCCLVVQGRHDLEARNGSSDLFSAYGRWVGPPPMAWPLSTNTHGLGAAGVADAGTVSEACADNDSDGDDHVDMTTLLPPAYVRFCDVSPAWTARWWWRRRPFPRAARPPSARAQDPRTTRSAPTSAKNVLMARGGEGRA
jgi:hypothetical protein